MRESIMPRNMSFMMTSRQYQDRTKHVTRRLGWWDVKTGELINGVLKAQGLKKGETVVTLGQHRVISARAEPLSRMIEFPEYGLVECHLEGFPELSPGEFVDMFCRAHNNCSLHTVVNRIEFDYVDGLAGGIIDRCPRTLDLFAT
jgi:hypothetical protein